MTKEEHREKHKQLHHSLDELLADFITHTKALPSKTSILELVTWSSGQTKDPIPRADGEIVKAARRFSEVAFSHCGPGPKRTATEAFARAIEARADEGSAEIGTLEDRIEDVEDALPWWNAEIDKLKGKVEDLDEKFKVHQEVHSLRIARGTRIRLDFPEGGTQ